jgi:hypothetical protein
MKLTPQLIAAKVNKALALKLSPMWKVCPPKVSKENIDGEMTIGGFKSFNSAAFKST